MAYTNEDKEAFARKDRLIVAQSTLERAIEYHVGANSSFKLSDVLLTAKTFFDHVFNMADGNNVTTEHSEVKTKETPGGLCAGGSYVSNSDAVCLPTPTVAQTEWLEKIKEKYGFSKENVWEKCKKYPSNKEDAIEIIKIMKGN